MAGLAPLTSLAHLFAALPPATGPARPRTAAPAPPPIRGSRAPARLDAAAALEAVDQSCDVAGLPAADAGVAFVVTAQPAALLEATFQRCPDLRGVLLIVPPSAMDELLEQARAGWGATLPERCFVADFHDDPADAPTDTLPLAVYLTFTQFLRDRGCAPSAALLICDDGIPPGPAAPLGPAAIADDLCVRFSARFFAEVFTRDVASPTPVLTAALLRQQADFLFEARDFYHALKFYWPLHHATSEPAPAWRILECWSELGCPDWVDLWLDQPVFTPDFRAQVRAELGPDLADDRALCAARFERNRAGLIACDATQAAPLRPAPRGAFALVLVANVPWKIATAPARGTLCLERGEYRLLVRTSGPTLVEANPGPRWNECEGAIGALRILGQPHVGVAGWVRNAWTTQLFLSLKPADRIPGWVQQIFLIEPDIAALAALLSIADLSQFFTPDRIRLFIGLRAQADFTQLLRDHADCPPVGIWAGLDRALDAETKAIANDWLQRAGALKRQLDLQHDAGSLRATVDVLQGRAQRPLRVFFTTSIYTDVLQYMVADLAAGFRTLGHECLVLAEARAGERLHPATIAARLLEFRADVMVLLDHTRGESSAHLPAQLPCVTWIQDELPALRDPENVAQLTALDLAYTLNTELQVDFRRRGYPFVGHLPFAVDPSDFPAPASAPAAARRAEIIFATNVGEVPERTDAPAARAALERRLLELPEIPLSDAALATVLRDVCAEIGFVPPTPEQQRNLDYWAFSIARRLDRLHVADVLLRAGLPLALYGRGWEAIPRFAPHHRGVVAPGAPVRAVYAQAKVVLHINRGCNLHPRLLDGFLAGAFVVARHDPADDLPGETIDQFDLGRELCLYRDDADLIALCQRALRDEDWRASVVTAAQRRIRRDHTFTQRAAVVLSDLRRVLTEVATPG
jgi:hypothetical protein